MGFGSYLGNGFKMLGFNKQAVASVRDESLSFRYAIILTCFIAVFYGVFTTLTEPSLSAESISIFSIILACIFAVVGTFILTLTGAGITHILARLFGGAASIKQYYAVWLAIVFALSVVSLPLNVILFLPPILLIFLFAPLFLLFAIYAICVTVFTIKETYTLSTGKAVLVCLIPVIVIVLLVFGVLAFFGVLSPDRFIPV